MCDAGRMKIEVAIANAEAALAEEKNQVTKSALHRAVASLIDAVKELAHPSPVKSGKTAPAKTAPAKS